MAETLANKLPTLDFSPEGYTSPYDLDYLEQLKRFLESSGLDTRKLAYTGFDGTKIEKSGHYADKLYTFAMNEAGWRHAIAIEESNPARYAYLEERPYLALYDKDRLRDVASGRLVVNKDGTIENLVDIVPGKPLAELPDTFELTENVVHLDYPNQPVSAALIGFVRLGNY